MTLCATAPAGLLVRLRDSRTVTQLGNVTDDIIDSESESAVGPLGITDRPGLAPKLRVRVCRTQAASTSRPPLLTTVAATVTASGSLSWESSTGFPGGSSESLSPRLRLPGTSTFMISGGPATVTRDRD